MKLESKYNYFHYCLLKIPSMLVSLLSPRYVKGTSWWRHQMETFSALLAICAGNSPVPVNSPHKGQWHRALISAWINGWVNNREAGDLRRNPPIMTSLLWSSEPALLISLCQCDVYITFHEICTCSCFVVFCCDLVKVDFIDIFQGYFTGTGHSIRITWITPLSVTHRVLKVNTKVFRRWKGVAKM